MTTRSLANHLGREFCLFLLFLDIFLSFSSPISTNTEAVLMVSKVMWLDLHVHLQIISVLKLSQFTKCSF